MRRRRPRSTRPDTIFPCTTPFRSEPYLVERASAVSLPDYAPAAFPVEFWDLFGSQGHPLRTTVSEIGPLLPARLLELNETQAGVLAIALAVAYDEGLLLPDHKPLRSILTIMAYHAKAPTTAIRLLTADSLCAPPGPPLYPVPHGHA